MDKCRPLNFVCAMERQSEAGNVVLCLLEDWLGKFCIFGGSFQHLLWRGIRDRSLSLQCILAVAEGRMSVASGRIETKCVRDSFPSFATFLLGKHDAFEHYCLQLELHATAYIAASVLNMLLWPDQYVAAFAAPSLRLSTIAGVCQQSWICVCGSAVPHALCHLLGSDGTAWLACSIGTQYRHGYKW